MEEVRVGEQLFLIPHERFHGARHGIEDRVAHGLGQLLRPLLDDAVARIRGAVDRVAEAHDLFLTLQHTLQPFDRLAHGSKLLDKLHGRLVRAAVEWAPERANGPGDAGVHIGQGGGANPRREGGRVELMFRVEDERDVHHLLVERARRFPKQGVEEMAGNGVIVRGLVNPHAVVGEAIPVVDDGRENGKEPIGHVTLLGEILLRFEVAQHGATGPHHIHGMGGGGNALEHFFQGLRQCPQGLQLKAIGVELGLGRQRPLKNEVGDLFKAGVLGQIGDVIAPIGEPRTGFADGAEGRFPCDLAPQAGASEFFSFSHYFDSLLFSPNRASSFSS